MEAKSKTAVSKMSAEELRFLARTESPAFKFQNAARDLRAIREAQNRLGHIFSLNDAFNCAVQNLKNDLHQIIDML